MKKGDIIICSKPEGFNFRTSQLVVGDKYEIVSNPFIMDVADQLVFDVKNVETGKIHTWVKSINFITLEVLREFKLREILN
jgi:hypothetical protein